MKKYFLMATLALVTVALIGCKDKKSEETTQPEGQTETTYKVVLSDEELELPFGYYYELSAVISPSKDLAITWTSSNEKVATVDEEGKVIGIAEGTATITASAEGATPATCAVTVVHPMSMIHWGGFGIFGLDKQTILSKDTIKVTLNSGQEVSCVMIPATYQIWSDDIYLDADGYMNGAGYVISAEGTALLITDDLGKGPNYHYLGTSSIEFVNAQEFNWNDTAYAYCCPTGTYGKAEDQLEWLMADSTSTLEPAIYGSYIEAIDYTNQQYLGHFLGLAGRSIFVGDESSVMYRANIGWFMDTDQYYALYGLLGYINQTDGYWYPLEPAQWAPVSTVYYEDLGSSAAPARKVQARNFKPVQPVKASTTRHFTQKKALIEEMKIAATPRAAKKF